MELIKSDVILRIEKAMGVELDENQTKMVLHKGTPLNGLACAGSGKTTTSIARLLKMELEDKVNPASITAISFNRDAVEEMKARHKQACDRLGIQSLINFRTFHSFYRSILLKAYPKMEIAEDGRLARDFRNICLSVNASLTEEQRDTIKNLRSSQTNNLILDTKEFIRTPKFVISNIDPSDYIQITSRFDQVKQEAGVWEFDDLQLEMYNLVKNHQRARDYIKRNWKYWFVDEYQDISKIQMEIFKLIIEDYNNLATTGDDDQAIYEFRGASADFIVDFPLHFMNASRIIMPTNYRCPSNILEPMERSISRNVKRVAKDMISNVEGGTIRYVPADSTAGASRWIADDILDRFENKDYNLKDIAVLYRNLKQQLFIIDLLLENGIPVKTSKTNSLIYNHFIMNDYRDIISLALNPTNPGYFKKVILKVTKFLRKQEVDAVARKMNGVTDWYDFFEYANNDSVHTAKRTLDMIRDMVENKELMNIIIPTITPMYVNYLEFLTERIDLSLEEAFEIINYASFIGRNKGFQKFIAYLERGIALVKNYEKHVNAVSVNTMHTVKGLEYRLVYLLYVGEENCPNVKILNKLEQLFGKTEAENHIEQERRLFYVAGTRAKEELIITYPHDDPSRYILETLDGDIKDVAEPMVTLVPDVIPDEVVGEAFDKL